MTRNLTSFVLSILILLFSNCNYNSHAEDDFKPLFNGEDLEGWVNVNCAPETWTIRDGLIICTGKPTGILRTDRQYENFILELEWKHLHKDGNAGLFIHSDDITAPGQPFSRSVECQIMDGNHGDVFAIHGASMTRDNEDPFYNAGWMRTFPREERANPFGEWNHYRVESRDGILTLAVNGKVVSRAFHVNPRKGYICLESEGSEVHFKNIRIKELPGSSPLKVQTAVQDRGFVSLYNGQDLRGWNLAEEVKSFWQPDDWRLVTGADPAGTSQNILWTDNEYKDFNLIVDWRFAGEPVAKIVPVILPDGTQALDPDGDRINVPIRYAGEGKIVIRGSDDAGILMTTWPEGSGGILGYREDGVYDTEIRRSATPILRADNKMGEWNRFEITVIQNEIKVLLNGETVIDNVLINDLPGSGAIGIQVPDMPMEFANFFIKEL
jgi:hypothetical protein